MLFFAKLCCTSRCLAALRTRTLSEWSWDPVIGHPLSASSLSVASRRLNPISDSILGQDPDAVDLVLLAAGVGKV